MTGRIIRFLMGLLSLAIGGTIICWVLYNYLVERKKEFTGGNTFSGFGIPSALVGVGIYWMKIAITGTSKRKTTEEIARDYGHLP